MTVRVKPVRRVRRSLWAGEDRQRFWVTLGFIALIVVALLILGGAVAANYYNDHLKPIAKVGDTQITRDDLVKRAQAVSFRMGEAIKRVREAMARGDIDAGLGQQQIASIQQQQQNVGDIALNGLIDEAFLGRLAPGMNVAVTQADVDAELEREATMGERRHVLAIFVEPDRGPDGLSTEAQKAEARQAAEEALADLNDGVEWADVAAEFSTDSSKDRGGDYGVITEQNESDDDWVDAVFKLALNETTPVIEGVDGTYRIGRVTEITPAVRDEGFLQRVDEVVGRDVYGGLVRADLLRRKLDEAVVAQATVSPQEQVHAYEILLRLGDETQDPTEGGPEVRASHILYSPKDDVAGASELPENDPAWAAAKAEADAAAAILRNVSDTDERAQQFADKAELESDDTSSGADGGDLGWFPRGRMVQEFADAVFEGTHTEGEIIGPVKSQFGYHVILYVASRPPITDRLAALKTELAKPNADFEQLAEEQSDATNADDGGEIGWVARYQVEKEIEDTLFGLQAGQVTTEPVQRDDGYHFYRVKERTQRELTNTQRNLIEQLAFQNWYDPQREKAQEDGTIFVDESVGSLATQ